MKILSLRNCFLFLLGVTASSAIDIGDILGIDCVTTSNVDDLLACADETLKAWLEDIGEFLDIECLQTAGTNLDLLRDCADQTARDLLTELGDITGIDCLTGSTADLESLEDCAAQQLSPVFDCFDTTDTSEIIKCANETIDDVFGVLDELPACVEGTLGALAECAVDNADSCAGTCSDAASLLPLATLSFSDMTCPSLQSGLVTPLCSVASCCTPCVPALEAVAQCMVEEVLVLEDDTECTLTCPARRLRELADCNTDTQVQVSAAAVSQEQEDTSAVVQCGTDMQGERRTVSTVETVMECATVKYLDTIEKNASENSGAASRTGTVLTVLAIVAVAMW